MINDEIKALLGEDTISQETAEKLSEMLNAAIDARLQESAEAKDQEHTAAITALTEAKDAEIAALTESKDAEIATLKESVEEVTQKADAHIESMKALVEERIQASVDSAVAEFVTENKTMFEQLDAFNRMKSAFDTIQEAFETNGFVLNPNAELDATKTELSESVAAYDKIFGELETTKKNLDEAHIDITFRDATAELTESQKEKVKALSEGVSFEGVEEYSKVLSLIVEQVSQKSGDEGKVVNESAKPVSPKMKGYLDYLYTGKKS